ncbi:MAG: glycosyltransferase [Verrucomicrobiaceae bacterium]|nr:glycosyltransferase [Verrucomicrobiaceae bacterium]
MKLLHVPFAYYPDACGGTEVYVAALCRFLSAAGVENVVAAPATEAADYEHEGVRVHRFAVHPAITQRMMFVEGDPVAAAGFARILDDEKPDIVHFHANSPAVSILCLREARKRGIPALSTYHTPTVSCQRGTLMRWGVQPCDGGLRPTVCAACFLNAHGMPRAIASMTAVASYVTRPLAALPGLSNATRAVLGASPLVVGRMRATHEWWSGMKKVIALCRWTESLLLLNKVPAERIRLVRHGLPTPAKGVTKAISPSPLRLVFLGRLDPDKGIDLIINAMRLAPDLSVTLDLFIISPLGENSTALSLRLQTEGDPRITLRAPVPSTEVVDTLKDYHALLVPSRWLETGPLVVLEAFAAGIPVIGSDLGGIAEWVEDGRNGLLVKDLSVQAWGEALRRIAQEPDLLPQLRAGVEDPRTMREVAAEMYEIYVQVLAVIVD